MRLILSLLVIGAAAYIGYNFYLGNNVLEPILGLRKDASEETAADDSPAPQPSVPLFESKIEAPPDAKPGEKQYAPPGTLYMIDRVSIEHPNGVAAAIPGEKVQIMLRKGDGTIKVTSGKYDFEVKESQVTNDLDVAREAERKYIFAHPDPTKR